MILFGTDFTVILIRVEKGHYEPKLFTVAGFKWKAVKRE